MMENYVRPIVVDVETVLVPCP